jgi:hypothetical protein
VEAPLEQGDSGAGGVKKGGSSMADAKEQITKAAEQLKQQRDERKGAVRAELP